MQLGGKNWRRSLSINHLNGSPWVLKSGFAIRALTVSLLEWTTNAPACLNTGTQLIRSMANVENRVVTFELIPDPIAHPKPHQPKIADTIYLQDNSRLNLSSTDNSTNVAFADHNEVFAALNEKATSISDDVERAKIVAAIAEMEAAHKSGGFETAYTNFMATAADHMTVFLPFLPALAHLLTKWHH